MKLCRYSLLRSVSLFCLTMVALLSGGCGDSRDSGDLEWVPPPSGSLPAAFNEYERVPHFAREWCMPSGFIGFTARWNERVRLYLAKNLKEQGSAAKEALALMLATEKDSTAYRAARERFLAAHEKCAGLTRRRDSGDYLVYYPEEKLPAQLNWENGAEQPELGSPEARKGGTVRLALQRSFPGTFRVFGPNSNNATRHYIYDDIDIPLVRLHPGTGEIMPGTADRWAVSEDGRTVYYHLDEKARFSDGSPLTTRDFITALYVRTSEYGGDPFYSDFYLNSFSRIAVYGDRVIAVTLADPHTMPVFRATIPAACTAFYAEFGPDYPSRYQWRATPTTGGYELDPDTTVPGRRLGLRRVKNWWAADRRYTRYSCNVDRIIFSFIVEPAKIIELFRIGELDVLSTRDADVWYEGLEIPAVHRGYIQRVHFSNMWPRNCFGVHLNCSRFPLNDLNVRVGLHYAFNVQAVINTVFRGDYSRLGSYFTGFGEYTDENITARPYSPEKAREYFALAGFTEEDPDGILCRPDGTRLQVVVSSRIDPMYANCMNLLREDAAHCGVELLTEQMDDTVFYRKVKDKQYAAALFSWGFTPPLPNPAPFFLSRYAYMADGSPAKGTSNITATASPELDAAVRECAAAGDKAAAVAAHHRVQQLIHREACWIPGWTTSYWRFAQWRWVRWPDTPECRFCPPRYYDPLDSHLYWIDETEKKNTLEARASGRPFEECELSIPLPESP